jgi:hypothetical protein
MHRFTAFVPASATRVSTYLAYSRCHKSYDPMSTGAAGTDQLRPSERGNWQEIRTALKSYIHPAHEVHRSIPTAIRRNGRRTQTIMFSGFGVVL